MPERKEKSKDLSEASDISLYLMDIVTKYLDEYEANGGKKYIPHATMGMLASYLISVCILQLQATNKESRSRVEHAFLQTVLGSAMDVVASVRKEEEAKIEPTNAKTAKAKREVSEILQRISENRAH